MFYHMDYGLEYTLWTRSKGSGCTTNTLTLPDRYNNKNNSTSYGYPLITTGGKWYRGRELGPHSYRQGYLGLTTRNSANIQVCCDFAWLLCTWCEFLKFFQFLAVCCSILLFFQIFYSLVILIFIFSFLPVC